MSKKSWLIGGILAALLGFGTFTLQAAEVTPAQVAEYRAAAEKGDAEAQLNLGRCYYNGDGVTKDLEKAAYWCRKAAEQGHAKAQFNLGWCYEKGEGVPKDLEKAAYWYQKAAEQGRKEAQEELKRLGK